MRTGFVEVIGLFSGQDVDYRLQTNKEIHYIINTNEIYCVSKMADGKATIYLKKGGSIITFDDFEEYRRMLCGRERSLFGDSE